LRDPIAWAAAAPAHGGGGCGATRARHLHEVAAGVADMSAAGSDATLSQAAAVIRSTMVGDVEYYVELDLTTGAETFTSRTIARFTAQPGASSFIDLTAVEIGSAVLNGRALRPRPGHKVDLHDLCPVNELVINARCAYSRVGMGMHRFHDPVDGAVYLYTQFQPFSAHRVYACFDQPDIKARVTLTVHAPPEWIVVSNGIARRDGDDWQFDPTPPISTYVTAVVAGPLHCVLDRHGDLDLGVYCRSSLAAYLDPDEILDLTRQGLDFYSELFGRPYPFAKYDQLFVPEFNLGAMENVGCVTVDDRDIFRSMPTEANRLHRANVLLHELSHMWFGNLVTMRWWDDLWLNESFATYLASLALAEVTRFRERAWVEFAHFYKPWAYEQDQRPSTRPIVADVPDTAGLLAHFDGITYAKGAAVLKQLAHWVGRDAFQTGMRAYIAAHEFGTANLADFLHHLERASDRDLVAWSRQWLHTTGVGTLRIDTTVDSAGRYLAFDVLQEIPDGEPTARDHQVALGLYTADGDNLRRRQRVEIDLRGQRTPVTQLIGAQVPDLLLINDDDLAYTKIELDENSVATLVGRLGHIRSPLARTLCWSALWAMTRDAVLPTRSWVQTVVRHAVREDDATVLHMVLGQAATAIDHYAAPGRAGELKLALVLAARAAMREVEPGSDAQLIWVRRLIASDDDPAFARRLLCGSTELDGLTVDTDLRWRIVIRLAALGAVGEEAITAECERDSTDTGRRRAWAARACLPQPAAKAAAFAAAVHGVADNNPLSLATQRAILTGFWRADQSKLLAEYTAHGWIDALNTVWEQRDPDESLALTPLLFPSVRASAVVVAAADRVLASDILPPAGCRIVTERRDDTLRALRAQTVDTLAWESYLRAGDRDRSGHNDDGRNVAVECFEGGQGEVLSTELLSHDSEKEACPPCDARVENDR
jgi:aminopeptidase N